MPKQTSPFRGFSVAEAKRAEQNSYIIQIANDFYNKDGNFIFTASQAEKHYNILLDNILYTIDNGSTKQKDAAMKCLMRLHILPLRYH